MLGFLLICAFVVIVVVGGVMIAVLIVLAPALAVIKYVADRVQESS